MLVLTAKKNSKIFITNPDGTETEVMVLSTAKNGDIRLGFTAPKSINIVREKVRMRALKQLPADAKVISHAKKDVVEQLGDKPATA